MNPDTLIRRLYESAGTPGFAEARRALCSAPVSADGAAAMQRSLLKTADALDALLTSDNRHGRFINQVLALVPTAVLVLAEDGRLEAANTRAVRLAESCRAFTLSEGELAWTQQADAAALENAIRRSRRQSFFVAGAHSERLIVSVSRPARRGHSPVPEACWVVVQLFPIRPRQAYPDGFLERTLGFTPAEARVARALVKGRNLTTVAQSCRITVSTARAHLQHMFAKTQTSRQSDLMRLLVLVLRAGG